MRQFRVKLVKKENHKDPKPLKEARVSGGVMTIPPVRLLVEHEAQYLVDGRVVEVVEEFPHGAEVNTLDTHHRKLSNIEEIFEDFCVNDDEFISTVRTIRKEKYRYG